MPYNIVKQTLEKQGVKNKQYDTDVNGYIDTAKVYGKNFAPSNVIQQSDDAETYVASPSYVKVKELQIPNNLGEGKIKVYWEMHDTIIQGECYARIYKNGVAISPEYDTFSTSYTPFSYLMDNVKGGDLIQLYGATGSDKGYFQNFRLEYDIVSSWLTSYIRKSNASGVAIGVSGSPATILDYVLSDDRWNILPLLIHATPSGLGDTETATIHILAIDQYGTSYEIATRTTAAGSTATETFVFTDFDLSLVGDDKRIVEIQITAESSDSSTSATMSADATLNEV